MNGPQTRAAERGSIRSLPLTPALSILVAVSAVTLTAGVSVLIAVARAGPSVDPGPAPTFVSFAPNHTIEQTFFNPPCEFSQFSFVAKREGSQSGSLVVSLHRLLAHDTPASEPSWTRNIDIRSLDGNRVTLRFQLNDAWHQTFRARFEVKGDEDARVALMVNPRSAYARGELKVDSAWKGSSDLVFTAGSDSTGRLKYLHCALGIWRGAIGSPVFLALGVAFCLLTSTILAVTLGTSEARTSLPEPTRASFEKRTRGRGLIFVLLLYFTCGLLWFLTVPPFEGPDEMQHYDFVRYVAAKQKLPDTIPQRVNEGGWFIYQWIQEPLYYVLLSPLVRLVGGADAAPALDVNPRSRWMGGSEGPLHAHSRPPPSDLFRTLLVLRTTSLLLGAGTVWLMYRLLLGTSGDWRLATLGCLGLLLVPPFTAHHVVVNNDTLATFLGTAASLLILTSAADPKTIVSPLVIGLASGAALATKVTTAGVVPMMVCALWLRSRREPNTLWKQAGTYVVGLAVTGGWVVVRNWIVFGDPLALELKLRMIRLYHPAMTRSLSDFGIYPQLAQDLFRLFWARFGWSNLGPLPGDWVWRAYLGATLLLIVAIGILGVRLSTVSVEDRPKRLAVIALAGVITVFAWINPIWTAVTPRYLYPSLAPLLVLTALGAQRLVRVTRDWIGPPAMRLIVGAVYTMLAVAWIHTFRDVLLGFHFGF